MAYHCCLIPSVLVTIFFLGVAFGNYDLRYRPADNYLRLRPGKVLLVNCSLIYYPSQNGDEPSPQVRTKWKYNDINMYVKYGNKVQSSLLGFKCLRFVIHTEKHSRTGGGFNVSTYASIRVNDTCASALRGKDISWRFILRTSFDFTPHIQKTVTCYQKVIHVFPKSIPSTESPKANSTEREETWTTGNPETTESPVSEMEKLKREMNSLNLTGKALTLEKTTSSLPLSPLDVKELGSIVQEITSSISGGGMRLENEEEKERVIENMVQTTSNVLSKRNVWEKIQNATERLDLISIFTAAVEEISLTLTQHGDLRGEFAVTRPMVSLKLVSVREEEVKVDFRPKVAATVRLRNESGEGASRTKDGGRVVVVLYDGISRLFSRNDSSDGDSREAQVLISDILGATASRSEMVAQIDFLLSHKDVAEERPGRVICAFWNKSRSAWDTNGCRVLRSDRVATRCECDHLTNFAVLMDFTGKTMELEEIHMLILSVITYSGCTLSILVCLFAGLGYEFARQYAGKQAIRESKMTNIIYEGIFFCICAADFTFIVGINRTEHSALCGIIAGLLHYLLLLQFEWMTAIGVFYVLVYTHPYHLTVVEAHCRWLLLSLLVLPAVVVAISAAVGYRGFGSARICWLSSADGVIWTFIGPLSVLLGVNMCLLGVLIYLTEKHTSCSSEVLADIDANKTWIMNRRMKYRYELVFAFALGVTWLFGYPHAGASSSLVTSYIFCVFNAFQGLIVCAVCASWHRMRDGYVKFLNRHDRFADRFCLCLKAYRQRRMSRSSSTRNAQSFSVSPKDTQSSALMDSSDPRYSARDSRNSVFAEIPVSEIPSLDAWSLRIKKIPYIDRDSVVDPQWEQQQHLPANS